MTDVHVVAGVRTPFGKFGGALADVRPDDLASLVISELVDRASVDPTVIDEVVFGCANQAGEDNRNVARMAALLAGLPMTIPAYTVNRLCASGLTAITSAAQQIRSGEADVMIAGGVESMTRAPWVMARPTKAWAKPGEVADSSLGWRFVNPRMVEVDDGDATIGLGQTAERVAALEGISRADSDAFALSSHERAVAATSAGLLRRDLVAVDAINGIVIDDEGPRADASLQSLAKLKPAFSRDGIITPGSASPLSDGAAAVLLASDAAVQRYGLHSLARISGASNAGVQPSLMGLGPVPATRKLLERLNLKTSDLNAVEINEAFAPQVLACLRQLDLPHEKVNAWGGAIALGHPLGASGARLVITLARRMEADDARLGLATLCVGVGQGTSLVLERS